MPGFLDRRPFFTCCRDLQVSRIENTSHLTPDIVNDEVKRELLHIRRHDEGHENQYGILNEDIRIIRRLIRKKKKKKRKKKDYNLGKFL